MQRGGKMNKKYFTFRYQIVKRGETYSNFNLNRSRRNKVEKKIELKSFRSFGLEDLMTFLHSFIPPTSVQLVEIISIVQITYLYEEFKINVILCISFSPCVCLSVCVSLYFE